MYKEHSVTIVLKKLDKYRKCNRSEPDLNLKFIIKEVVSLTLP